ncbi:MAG TPA: Holliday junction branch migration protein RuvA [Planctomycetota bacterium]|nr:Holliday junction branch migration protein RuvA [Planctomycetota bacterium]
MYDYLEGKLAAQSPARLVLDVHGVGYELTVPLTSTFVERELLRVFVHQVVREDEHRLYGFADAGTRDLFRLLLTVRGVGPSAALGLLSGLSAAELVGAIRESDLRKLMSVKGIGKKTAEQLLLDLREKILSFSQKSSSGALSRPSSDQRVEDAVTALLGIGFSEKEARKAVERAVAQVGGSDVELLVRTALAR